MGKKQSPASDLFRHLNLSDVERFDEGEFLKDVNINLDNLQVEIARHSGKYYKYGKLHALAMRELSRARSAKKVHEAEGNKLWARLDRLVRKKGSPDGERLTRDAIEASIRRKKSYLMWLDEGEKLQDHIDEFEFSCALLELAEKIFSKRTDSLHTLGYMAQAELKTQGVVLSREEKRRRETDSLKRNAESIVQRSLKKRRRR